MNLLNVFIGLEGTRLNESWGWLNRGAYHAKDISYSIESFHWKKCSKDSRLVNIGAGGEVVDKRGFKESGWELVDWIGVALNRVK